MFAIDIERFGGRTEFETIEEAELAIRDCGPEFADVRLFDRGGTIYDERGEIVGRSLT